MYFQNYVHYGRQWYCRREVMHSVVVDGVLSVTSKRYNYIFIFSLLSKTLTRAQLRHICTDWEFYVASKSFLLITSAMFSYCRSQWLRCLMRRTAAAGLSGLRVLFLPAAFRCVSFESCALTGRVLCGGLIPRQEESCRLWCGKMR